MDAEKRPSCLEWNLNGSLIGVCTEKDRKIGNKVKIFDPRGNKEVLSADIQPGRLKPKMVFMGTHENYIATLGSGDNN